MKNVVTQFLTQLICFQLLLSPILSHAQTTPAKPKVNAANVISTVGSVAGSFMQFYNQNQAQLTAQQQMSLQQNGRHPFFRKENLLKIPGFANYLQRSGINPLSLDCLTPQKRIEDVENDVCKMGVLQFGDVPVQMQVERAKQLNTYYSGLKLMYEDYQLPERGNELYGVGCMKNVSRVLQGFFKEKMTEMDTVKAELESLHKKFTDQAKMDRDKIAFTAALLNGGNNDLVNEMKAKFPNDFKFDQQMAAIQGCSSMYSGDQANANGSKGGLSGIYREIQTVNNTPGEGSKISVQSLMKPGSTQMLDLENDLKSLITNTELSVKNKAQNIKDPSSLAKELQASSASQNSAFGLNRILSNPSNFAETNQKFETEFIKWDTKKNNVRSILGSIPEDSLTNPNNNNLSSEIARIKRSYQQSCIKRELGPKLAMIADPNRYQTNSTSKFAISNSMKNIGQEIDAIVNNSEYDLEQMEVEINRLAQQRGLNNLNLRREANYKTWRKVGNNYVEDNIAPNTFKSPAQVLKDHLKVCEARFNIKAPGQPSSPAQALNQLTQLKTEHNQMNQNLRTNLKNELNKRFLTCQNSSDSNANSTNNCGTGSFSPSNSSFCFNNVRACAQNMYSCQQKLDQKVRKIEADQNRSLTNYKSNMKKYENDLNKLLDRTMGKFIAENQILSKPPFNIPFESPEVLREVPESEKYLKDFRALKTHSGGSILIEDPEKMLVMHKKNIDAMKKSIEKQATALVGGVSADSEPGGLIAKEIARENDIYKKNIDRAGKIADECGKVYQQFLRDSDNQMGEAMKKQQEALGEFNAVCDIIEGMDSHPIGACEELNELSADALKSAMQVMASQQGGDAAKTLREIRGVCKSFMAEYEFQTKLLEKQLENCMFPKTIEGKGENRTETIAQNNLEVINKCKQDFEKQKKDLLTGLKNQSEASLGQNFREPCKAQNNQQSNNKVLDYIQSVEKGLNPSQGDRR